MSMELVGFENLPNVYIKENVIYKYSDTEIKIRTTVCIHDLKDGSIWSDTSEFLAQLLNISVLYSENTEQSNNINDGLIDITTLKNIQSKSVKKPMKSDDNLTYEYTFTHITKKDPDHLTVYAFCQIKKESILENLGIVVPKSYLGPIKAERIYSGSSLVDNTFVFVRNNGEYWSGPVHQTQNGRYMIGSYHTANAHEHVSRIIVKNVKLKDMRDIVQTQQTSKVKVSNVISDLQVSYSSNTDINGLFMLNIKSLLKNNTKYGSFLERASDSIINQIISNFTIKLMTIHRMRIKSYKQPTSLRSAKVKAQKIHSKKTICKSYDVNGILKNMTRLEKRGIFDIVESELRSTSDEPNRKTSEIFKEQVSDYKKISKIVELFFDYGEEIRTFQFNDYELTDTTPGEYQYTLDISFVDPVDLFLKSIIAKMKLDLSEIKRYVGHISRKRNITPSNADIQRLAESYVDNYSYVYQITDREKNNLISKSINLLNISTITLESVKKFQKQYEDLLAEFFSFLDKDPEVFLNNKLPVSLKSKDASTARIGYNHTFDKIIKPSNNKYGFGYMGDDKLDSMRMLSRREYEKRTEKETNSNFVEEPNIESPDLPDDVNSALRNTAAFSTAFFAPTFGKLNSQKIGLGFDKSIPFSKVNKLVNKATKLSNISKFTTKKPSVPTQEPTTEGDESFIEASKIIGSSHEFVSYSEIKDSYNVVDKQTSSATKVDNSISGYTNNRTFEVTLERTKLLTGPEAAALPNQLKAVIGGTTTSTRNEYISDAKDLLADPITKNYHEVNNFSVQQVVYIDGFMKDINNNILLNKPVFKLMSFDNFNVIDKPVLCFLQAYTNNKFNIEDENKTSVLDSVFILADKDIKTRNGVTNERQSNYNIQEINYIAMRSQIVVQTNQPVTVRLNQTTNTSEQTPNMSIVSTNVNVFGGY